MTFHRRRFLTLCGSACCMGAVRGVEDRWRKIAGGIDGTVGAAALHPSSGQMASLNGSERFPLASVCKLPIAMQILALVEEGKLALDQSIDIPLYDVWPGVSPVAERWPKQKSYPLHELVELMVAKSDNTAVQTLFRLAGEQAGMAERFRRWKILGMRLDRSELRCSLDAAGVRDIPPVTAWKPGMLTELTAKVPPAERAAAFRRFLEDPRDTGTPEGAVQLLRKLYSSELLSKEMTGRMAGILERTTTGEARIKGKLPAGTVVGHKTGTTATVDGLNGATNDVGAITLPNGSGRLLVAVFVKGSTRDLAAREGVIAEIARAAFDSLA
jgi:beta-lactamase class A